MNADREELAARLEERVKLKYIGDCKCGRCHLVPVDLIAEAAARLRAVEKERDEAREALEPFAHVGRIIDGNFGPALFANDDDAFKSGCAWTENGERKTLTWGHFRRAALQKAHDNG